MNEAAYIAMREERDVLAAENAYLKELYCAPPDAAFFEVVTTEFKAMPQVAHILWILWDCLPKTRAAIANSLWGVYAEDRDHKHIDVQIYRLRSALRPINATIATCRGRGFRLLREQRAIIAAHIGIEVKSGPEAGQ